MSQVATSRKGRKYCFPEAVLSLGPQTMGASLDGSYAALCAVPWALIWDKARGAVLLQQDGDGWREVTPGEAFPKLRPKIDRHISLCFDQAARHVFTWQHGEQFTVRQYSPALGRYVYQGPFSGVDPCLHFDAMSHYDAPQADVLVWYLSEDRLKLCYRIQRELYAVEHEANIFTAPVWLDQVATLPYQAQILATDAEGQPVAVMVGLYPYNALDTAQAAAKPPSGGELFEVVMVRSYLDAITTAATPPSSGELFEVIMVRSYLDAITTAAKPPSSGELFEAVIARSYLDAITTAATPPSGGSLTLVVVTHAPPLDAVVLGASAPTGGTLATV